MDQPGISSAPSAVAQSQQPSPEVTEAWEECDRQQRRADFLTDMLQAVLPELASDAVEFCVQTVTAQFQAEPARGFEDWGTTAWHEAAGILQADGHLLVEQVREDLATAALTAVAALSPTARLAAWLDTEPGALGRSSDLWDRTNLVRFDPLTERACCLDALVKRVVRRVVDQLPAVNLAG